MKIVTHSLILGLVASCLAEEPTMREKINVVLEHSDQMTQPPPTAKEMIRTDKKDATLATPEASVQLPDYEVTAPRIANKQKVELELAKNEVARRQEEANLVPTELSKIFGLSGIGLARERLKFLEFQEKILLTSLATADSEKDRKELLRLLAKDHYPTSH